jgi:hypothetical protein
MSLLTLPVTKPGVGESPTDEGLAAKSAVGTDAEQNGHQRKGAPPQLVSQGPDEAVYHCPELGEFSVLKEIKEAIVPQTAEERAALRDDIKANGCRVPAIVVAINSKFVLVDGHNRLEICRKLNTPLGISISDAADSIDEAVCIASALQVNRRNLPDNLRRYQRGKAYNARKKGRGGDQRIPSENVAASVAKTFGISPRTVKRDAVYASNVDQLTPKIKNAILRREIDLSAECVEALAQLDSKVQLTISAAKKGHALSSALRAWHDAAKAAPKADAGKDGASTQGGVSIDAPPVTEPDFTESTSVESAVTDEIEQVSPVEANDEATPELSSHRNFRRAVETAVYEFIGGQEAKHQEAANILRQIADRLDCVE